MRTRWYSPCALLRTAQIGPVSFRPPPRCSSRRCPSSRPAVHYLLTQAQLKGPGPPRLERLVGVGEVRARLFHHARRGTRTPPLARGRPPRPPARRHGPPRSCDQATLRRAQVPGPAARRTAPPGWGIGDGIAAGHGRQDQGRVGHGPAPSARRRPACQPPLPASPAPGRVRAAARPRCRTGRVAQRPAHVAAVGQRRPCRRPGPPPRRRRRSASGSGQVVRVAGGAEDLVERMRARPELRHVGLAEGDRPGPPHPLDDQVVLAGTWSAYSGEP